MEIELLTAPSCGKCEAAKVLARDVIESLRAEQPDLKLQIVDITEHPEVAVKYLVMSAPAIAINGCLAFTGIPREEALRARLRSAG